jgi:hypothetical protein
MMDKFFNVHERRIDQNRERWIEIVLFQAGLIRKDCMETFTQKHEP